jgi:non-ribosomal peptide synthetase component E (peptide arylation enzyme)
MHVGRSAVAELLEANDLAGIAGALPRRIHDVYGRHAAEFPDRVALIEDGASWTYRELDRSVTGIAEALRSLGVRAGDRIMIVSENSIALAGMLLGGEPDRCLGDRRQSEIVGARTRPDPRP